MDRRQFMKAVLGAGVSGAALATVSRSGDQEADPTVVEGAVLTRVTECNVHTCNGGFSNPGPNYPSICVAETCQGGFTCQAGPSGGGHICSQSHTCDAGHGCGSYIDCMEDLGLVKSVRSTPSELKADARRELARLLDQLDRGAA